MKFSPTEKKTLERASRILERAIQETGEVYSSPDMVKRYLQTKLAAQQREVFACLWLDNKHQFLAYEELFQGTIDGASVYPREVVKAALHHNAAAVILCHNHPSGISEPSEADKRITRRLADALALIDIRVLDHVIVGTSAYSFAEHGLI